MHAITPNQNQPTSDDDSAVASTSPASVALTGAAPAPAAPDFSVIDAVKARHVNDLAHMISSLRIVSEQIRTKWIEIAAQTEDFTHLENATAHLIREASELHSATLEFQTTLIRYQRAQRRVRR